MRERPLSMEVAGGDLTLGGVVDEESVDSLRSLLIELAQGSHPVRVDLSDVDYLPSFAIGVLARARAQAIERGESLELVAARGTPAQRVLEIAAIPCITGPYDVDPTDVPDASSDVSSEGLDAS